MMGARFKRRPGDVGICGSKVVPKFMHVRHVCTYQYKVI